MTDWQKWLLDACAESVVVVSQRKSPDSQSLAAQGGVQADHCITKCACALEATNGKICEHSNDSMDTEVLESQ
ncbi:hypothetical protein Tcan_10198 [Toxocara canis]|uniref:Uncharacterized protein n=1 Tax=Toxocara canis TaxID=6265 RepID=A0A0B2V2T7_TOXCA|nr:hypothetical protein Tcan_10198 [Toxocara canis]